MDIKKYVEEICERTSKASRLIAKSDLNKRNNALKFIADGIRHNKNLLFESNKLDLDQAKKNGISKALINRLSINEIAYNNMLDGLEQIISLPDPIGEITNIKYRPTGIQVGQMRVPIGVIGIIYESRPNVTIDAAALCIKSGNSAVLRGGSEAINCNLELAKIIKFGLKKADLPEDSVQIISTTDRLAITYLINMQSKIDIIVPRGGKGLIEFLIKNSKIPMIKHLDGICHVYIDDNADLIKAEQIAFNAKCQRLGTCNTMETLLVNDKIASDFLPKLCVLYEQENIELRVDEKVECLIKNYPKLKKAVENDWSTEYLDAILSIKIVENVESAIDHINYYSSHHTDSIVTENYNHAMKFLREVDSASVMVNASTRFADGFEYGLGAEIGISNDKLHARGPVGLQGLTSLKFIVLGNGQVRV